MKLKYFIPVFMAVVAMFVSCQDDDATYLGCLRVSSSYIALPAEGGSGTITVDSRLDWEVDTVGAFAKTQPWFDYEIVEEEDCLPKLVLTASATLDGRTTSFKILVKDDDGKVVAEQIVNVIQGLTTVTEATCADVIAGPDSKTYRVKGTVRAIANTTYGNWYLNDGTGELYVYGTLDAKGNTKNFSSLGIEVGDIVTVEGPKLTYGSTVELVDVTVVKIEKSLIKVDSLSVAGEIVTEAVLPIEGGDVTAYLTCKGNGVYAEIPDDAKDWLTIASVTGGSVPTITFHAAQNGGGERSATLVLKTTQGGKEYTAETTISQKGSIVECSIADFTAAEIGDTQYRLTGVINKVANETYGNVYINDFSGDTYVYGIGAQGDFAAKGLKVGDIITLVGKRGEYKGVAQMVSAQLEDFKSVTSVTIDEFLGKEDNADVYYMVSGVIDEISNPTYGNLYIKDAATGARLYVYGCYPGYGATGDYRKDVIANKGIKVGDRLTVIGVKSTYKGVIQVNGGIYFSHESAQ